jgi:hypothetical protein
MADDVISYQAATRGTPVLAKSGKQIGHLLHVLQVPEVDVFDGLVVRTHHGLRFIDADQVQEITRSKIRCSLSDAQADNLPKPEGGTAAFHFDGIEEFTSAHTQQLGEIFRRPRWRREDQG